MGKDHHRHHEEGVGEAAEGTSLADIRRIVFSLYLSTDNVSWYKSTCTMYVLSNPLRNAKIQFSVFNNLSQNILVFHAYAR